MIKVTTQQLTKTSQNLQIFGKLLTWFYRTITALILALMFNTQTTAQSWQQLGGTITESLGSKPIIVNGEVYTYGASALYKYNGASWYVYANNYTTSQSFNGVYDPNYGFFYTNDWVMWNASGGIMSLNFDGGSAFNSLTDITYYNGSHLAAGNSFSNFKVVRNGVDVMYSGSLVMRFLEETAHTNFLRNASGELFVFKTNMWGWDWGVYRYNSVTNQINDYQISTSTVSGYTSVHMYKAIFVGNTIYYIGVARKTSSPFTYDLIVVREDGTVIFSDSDLHSNLHTPFFPIQHAIDVDTDGSRLYITYPNAAGYAKVYKYNGSNSIIGNNLCNLIISGYGPEVINNKIKASDAKVYVSCLTAFPPESKMFVLDQAPAPTANAASLVTTTSFRANWNANSLATGYCIDVSTASDFSSFVINNLNVGNTTIYNVTVLNPGTIYYYRVRAINEWTSPSSSTITVTTLLDAPVATRASLRTVGGFTANWNAVNGAAGYRIDISDRPDFASGTMDINVGNVTSHTFNGLEPGKLYYTRVRAYTAQVTSANSNTINTIPKMETPGNALAFKGDNDNVTFGSWFVPNDYTISLWVKPAATQNANATILDNGSNFKLQQNGASTNQYTFAGATFTLDADKWQHIAITRSGSSGIIYVNGTQVQTFTNATAFSAQQLVLGALNGGGSAWKGTADELALYGSALSPAQINSLVYNSPTVVNSSYQAYYTFDHGIAGQNNASYTYSIDETDLHDATNNNFDLNFEESNFVKSYANMRVKFISQATTGNSITVEWSSDFPVDKYYITLSTNPDLSNPIAGYNHADIGNINTLLIDNLDINTYYYYNIWGEISGNQTAGMGTTIAYTQKYTTPGNALHFNGIDGFASVSADYLTSCSNNFTIEFWVNPEIAHEIDGEATSGVGGIAGQKYVVWPTVVNGTDAGTGVSVGVNGISVYEHAGGYMPALLVWQGNVSGWTHVAVVYENRQPRLYVNGIHVKSGQTSPRTNVYPSVSLGNGGYGCFRGDMDEFRVWNYVRSNKEIRNNLDKTVQPTESGLIAYYNFDEETGTQIKDITTNANNGTMQSGVERTLSIAPICPLDIQEAVMVTLDGNNDWVSVAEPGDDRLYSQSFSVALWVKPAVAQKNYACIVDANSGGANWGINQDGSNTNQYIFDTYENGGWNGTSGFSLPADEWSYLVVTRDAGSKQKKVYVNGVLKTTKTGTDDITYNNPGLILGKSYNYGREWAGSMDEFNFYEYALSLAEVKALYMSQKQYEGTCQPIYVPFDEDCGLVAKDYSITDFPAVLQGGAYREYSETPIDTGMTVPGILKISKGYYNDRVQIQWNVDKNWKNIIDRWYVYRKIYGTTDSTLIHSSGTGDNFLMFADESADAGVIYQYAIQGETDINGCAVVTNSIIDVGYRTPAGIVNGRISYEGGVAVEGARVIVTRQEGSVGNSLAFDGTDKGIIRHNDILCPSDGFTAEIYVRPTDLSGDMQIFNKEGSYSMYYTQADNSVNFKLNTSNGEVILKAPDAITIDNFTQITAAYNGTDIKIYIDGLEDVSVTASGTINCTENHLFFGDGFIGNLDEFRLWNFGKDSARVSIDYFRVLTGGETGIIGYWRFDEGLSPWSFDQAYKLSTFYANDMTIYGAEWSDIIPANEQLGLCGITNANGDYTIANIQYFGSGENFTLTPFLNVHKFEPSQTGIYIGEGSIVLNDQNFTDISSFKVTGTVKYKDCDCYAKDVYVEIDGTVAVKDGQLVKTDESGFFEVRVPIGYHKLSLMGINHTFEIGEWPVDGSLHEFTAPVSGLEFIDNTLRTVAGRVVGGTREGDKKLGFGKSVNNIGQAEIIFKSQEGNGCYTTSITTDVATGEYTASLPPLTYIVDKLEIPSNLAIDFGTLDLVDLTSILPTYTDIDTVYKVVNNVVTTEVDHVEYFQYNLKNNYIYRVPPEMDVTEMDDNPIQGERELEYTDKGTGVKTMIDLTATPFPYPVFFQAGVYDFKVTAFEAYQNKDADYLDDGTVNNSVVWSEDRVPVNDGKMKITNNFSEITETDANLTGGEYKYTFTGNNPNIAVNGITPEWSFTRTMSINLETDKHTVTWPPAEPFRAFLLGARASGSNFVTEGPQVVNFVLRDPPGSNSSTSLEKGSTLSFNYTINNSVSYATDFGFSVGGGLDISMGMGVMTRQALNASVKNQWNISMTGTVGGGVTQTMSNAETFSTSGETDYVGADGDVYVGKSMNYNYGKALNLKLLPKTTCETKGLPHYDTDVNGYTIGIYPGMYVVPSGYETMFLYTQKHIVENLIPNLIMLRNNLFLERPLLYQSHINIDDPMYGTSNDNPLWGASAKPDSLVNTTDDDSGVSYQFNREPRPANPPDDYVSPTDSVWWYNQQIRLWKEAIASNERTKQAATKIKNISFDGGSSYSASETSTLGWEVNTTFSVSLAYTMTTELTAEGAASAEAELGTSLTMQSDFGFTTTGEESQTYSYTLADADANDYFSVDIKKMDKATVDLSNALFGKQMYVAGSPIFYTQGGQSKCPYEGEIRSKYYRPDQVVLSNATMSRGEPSIEVISEPIVNNVPENNKAAFTLLLSNYSETGEDTYFTLEVDEASNPYGAVLFMDGALMNNRSILVPGNGSVQKIITMEKGPILYHYDDIIIRIMADCGDFEDETTVSAHFIPGCSDVSLLKPGDLWTGNYESDNSIPIIVGGYNLNQAGLENIKVQYKPVASSKWINLETYHRDFDPLSPDNELIPTIQAHFQYDWDIASMIDAKYDLRAVATCSGDVLSYSEVQTGIIDRINPRAFGTPQPAAGILEPDNEISIKYNEPIQEGMLTWSNFDIRGILNGGKIDHSTSVYFDGNEAFTRTPLGINFSGKSFTIEFWARRSRDGVEECFVSQGNEEGNSIYIGFDNNNKFFTAINGQRLLSNSSYINDGLWHHYAFVYNRASRLGMLIYDGLPVGSQTMTEDLEAMGMFIAGKRAFDDPIAYKGNMHELRIWYKNKPQADIIRDFYARLNGKEMNLAGCWRYDEATGISALDAASGRNAILANGAIWQVEPMGKAYTFDGNSYVEAMNTGTIFIKEQDFTLEFWFKGEPQNACLFSNGKGDGSDNSVSWTIMTDTDGKISLFNNGYQFVAVDSNFFDNTWHHFALVCKRTSNITAYIDGIMQNGEASENFNGFGGARNYLGARGWYDTFGAQHFDNYFTGSLDEYRVWNTARLQSQIARTMAIRQTIDAESLVQYYPFESYEVDAAGIVALNPALRNEMNVDVAISVGAADYTADCPTIRIPQTEQKVNFNFVTNVDKVIFEITDPPNLIENCILDITAKDVVDLNGNRQLSPATWSAYVNLNQMNWEEQELTFQKLLYAPMQFTATIRNSSGDPQRFEINNLPAWLKASPQNGVMDPVSTKTITFTVNEGVNNGYYNENIYLSGDFGFDEKLLLNLRVYQIEPEWEVNPADYQYSMSVIAQLKIEGAMSNDIYDIVGAFVDGECRGIARMNYIEDYDLYEVYLTVYSNELQGEQFDLHVWDASEAFEYSLVKAVGLTTAPYPNQTKFVFINNEIYGFPSNPLIIETQGILKQVLPLNKGWNWISFNLDFNTSVPLFQQLKGIEPDNSWLIKTENQYTQYLNGIGWNGTLKSLNYKDMFMFYTTKQDTLEIRGAAVETSTVPINIHENWNRISYLPQVAMPVKEALAAYIPNHGSVLKNQYSFAMYDKFMGWLGSLTYMRPNEGYMLYYAPTGTLPATQTFVYPAFGSLGKGKIFDNEQLIMNNEEWQTVYRENAQNMTILAEVIGLESLIGQTGQVGQTDTQTGMTDAVIGVFAGDNCVGYGTPTKMADGRTLFFVTANANKDVTQLTFKLLSGASSTLQGGGLNEHPATIEFTETTAFFANEMLGTFNEPFQLNTNNEKLTSDASSTLQGEGLSINIYPNPFKSSTNFELNITEISNVKIEIFDITGRKIDELNRSDVAAGNHTIEWEGSRFATGVYTAKIIVGDKQFTEKIVKSE